MDKQPTPIVHSFNSEKKTVPMIPILIGGVVIIIAGIATGYMLVKPTSPSSSSSSTTIGTDSSRKVFGAPDEKSFKDSSEGTLETGGANGEGTHKLIRPGGDSQTIYLTSSILDLNQFVGKRVRLWGETFAAKSAGWFMDVGRVEVLE